MKVHIVYSSLSGCTKKVAEAMFAGLQNVEKEISDVKDNPDVSDADIVVFGYWVDKGSMNEKAASWFKQVRGKRVFVFATLAYYADSEHGFQSVWKGVEAARALDNEVIGHYVCNGRLAPSLIERFKKMAEKGSDNPHAFTPEKGLRYEIMASHPTACELALGSERLNERVLYCQRLDALHK